MPVQENIPLQPYNSFGIDSIARYFASFQNSMELAELVEYPAPLQLILGGGSNILLTKNVDGLVLRNEIRGITELHEDNEYVYVKAGAGENWHEFVLYTLSKNYGGLENLSLIPGNVGTCPIQNIGAYGTEIKDQFVSCKALNLETSEIEELSLEDCKFGYRDSIFKTSAKGKYVIVEVTFKLTTQNHHIKTEYGAISTELKNLGIENPTIQEVSKAVINIRQSKLPNPAEIGNAGSFFKNPSIPLTQFENLKEKFSEIQGYANGDWVKVPAGWLIENAGWKGKQIGNVASHKLQALVIINATGNASGKEIYDFSTQIIDSVKEKYGIELEREVNIL